MSIFLESSSSDVRKHFVFGITNHIIGKPSSPVCRLIIFIFRANCISVVSAYALQYTSFYLALCRMAQGSPVRVGTLTETGYGRRDAESCQRCLYGGRNHIVTDTVIFLLILQ